VIVRCPTPDDRFAVREMLTRCGAFTDEEVRVALEMFDAGLTGDYSLLGIDADGALRAYACFGKATLTERSWYLYWICVDPAAQATGVGRALQSAVEDRVRELGGERLVLETSGRPDYTRARTFYERAGFTVHGRIPDFYKQGDDCLIYGKMLGVAVCG